MTLILNGTDNSATTPAVTGTDTDTGVYYPAANQVALATNGTLALIVDSSQNVGIGTTTPDALLQVYKASGKVATFGNNVNNSGNYVVLGGTVSNKNWVLANNMIIGGEFGIGRTSANGGTTIGSAYDLMIDTNGGVKVANTLGVGYTTPSTSGAGITFPATQSASSDANTLDDYEEGTWTPVANNITATNCTYAGYYIKIGKMVWCSMSILVASGGSFSSTRNTSYFSGLPFAISGTNQAVCGMSSNSITNNGTGMIYNGPVMYVPTASFSPSDGYGWVTGVYQTSS
jgi:hypothetical protein